MQVVVSGFSVQIVPTVTHGIQLTQRIRKTASNGFHLSPGVITVLYHDIPRHIRNAGHIPLQILHIHILCTIGINAKQFVIAVITEVQGICPVCLAGDPSIYGGVFGGNPIDRLLCFNG